MYIFRNVIVLLISVTLLGCSFGEQERQNPRSFPNQPSEETVQERDTVDNLGEIEDASNIIPTDGNFSERAQLNLPDGFKIALYAEVDNARSLQSIQVDNSLITFVGNRQKSSVYMIIDDNGDYQIDQVKEIASGLNSPNGVAYRDGDLYVAEIDRILVFRDILANQENTPYEVVFDDLPNDASHGWKYIAFGPDGRLYVPIGAPCNICDAGLPYSSLYALDVVTKEFDLVAEGIRNTVGFDWHPETGELRFTDNGRDWFGNDLPPDELNVITQDHQHFGYPFCHGGNLQDDQFSSRPCSEFTAPFQNLGPHVAALGVEFVPEGALSEEYENAVLIAEHGSWNRTPATGYRVSMVDRDEGGYVPFLDGFLTEDGDVLGRPVDMEFLPDGSFLLSDDLKGRVYRIRYQSEIEPVGDVVQPDQENDEESIPYSMEAFKNYPFAGSGLSFEYVEARTNAYTRRVISYMSNGTKISGIMNIPIGEGPFPVVILNHGYIDPTVYTVGRGLKREQDYLARQGYAVLHTDYRNHGASDKDPELDQNYLFRNYFYARDSINAILALQELDDQRLDLEHVGMLGHSMGGGVTMYAMIARPDLIDAGVLYAPVHSNEYFNMHRRRYGDLNDEERQLRTNKIGDLDAISTFSPYSPARNLERIQAPIQIYHGTNDESVPYQRSVDTLGAMEDAGLDVELITYEGEKHEFIPKFNEFMAGVSEFFGKNL